MRASVSSSCPHTKKKNYCLRPELIHHKICACLFKPVLKKEGDTHTDRGEEGRMIHHTLNYRLHVDNAYVSRKVRLDEFPDLSIQYVSVKNGLSLDVYGHEEGELTITLRVNDHEISLNNHDERDNRVSVVGQYEFKGVGASMVGRPRTEAYLIFTVRRIEMAAAATVTTTKKQYRLGQPFILEFDEVAGNGYTWWLKLPVEVEQITNTYAGECHSTRGDGNDEAEQDPGCSVVHSFVLKGVKRGKHTITATYNRPWQKEESVDRRTQEYEVFII